MATLHANYEFMTQAQASPFAAANTQGNSPAPKSSSAAANGSPYLVSPSPESALPGVEDLSIALIGPNDSRRSQALRALADCAVRNVREFSSYPPMLEDVPRMLEQNYDVIIVDLDSDLETALRLVESIGANGRSTVMVYSEKVDADLLMRCMRAGAREFLTVPFNSVVIGEALVRASVRRPSDPQPEKKADGKLMAFLGAKGGAGATTLACNFAVALAQETSQSTLLIDLDLPLGDAALNLGIVAEYSTIDALQAADRLDASFLSRLLVKHSSGVSVLAAPGRFIPYQASDEAIDRLIAVARQMFDNVVVDLGSRLDWTGSVLFREASEIFLVTQAGIPELRNSNRLISQFFTDGGPRLEIVINRYEARTLGISEEHITKALTRPVQWKIPNDYQAVRKMQINATPLALSDSPIARIIRQMARSVNGKPAQEKKKGFSLFG
jgi:pilus assembly protein CpaE